MVVNLFILTLASRAPLIEAPTPQSTIGIGGAESLVFVGPAPGPGAGAFPHPWSTGSKGARWSLASKECRHFRRVRGTRGAPSGTWGSGGPKEAKGSIPDPFSFNRLETPAREFFGSEGLSGNPPETPRKYPRNPRSQPTDGVRSAAVPG